MKALCSVAVITALNIALLSLPSQAQVVTENSSGDPIYTTNTPEAYSMVGDLLFARPLQIALTALGTATFLATLPFTAASGSVGNAGEALVVDPAKAAFVRCLGCTKTGYAVADEQ